MRRSPLVVSPTLQAAYESFKIFKVAKGIVQPKFINDGRSFAECYVGLFWQQFLTNFLESV